MAGAALSVDEAWLQLRRHLEWSRGHPSLVFVLCDLPPLVDDLVQRVELHSAHTRSPFADLDAGEVGTVPRPGNTILRLPRQSAAARYEALRNLNERRAALATAGAGCLILAGPVGVRREAALENADLWAVRSFALELRPGPAPAGNELPATAEGSSEERAAGYRFGMIKLPAEHRDERGRAVVRLLEAAALERSLPAALEIAGRAVAASEPGTFPHALAQLARAEIGARDGDAALVELAGRAMLDDCAAMPPASRRLLLDAAARVASSAGRAPLARDAAGLVVSDARELAERLATPESRRDLSISLNNAARVAEAGGDWARAGELYGESLGLSRELAERLATPESRRDLSISLRNTARVRFRQGDVAAANDRLAEAVAIMEEVAAVERTARNRDLLETPKLEPAPAD